MLISFAQTLTASQSSSAAQVFWRYHQMMYCSLTGILHEHTVPRIARSIVETYGTLPGRNRQRIHHKTFSLSSPLPSLPPYFSPSSPSSFPPSPVPSPPPLSSFSTSLFLSSTHLSPSPTLSPSPSSSPSPSPSLFLLYLPPSHLPLPLSFSLPLPSPASFAAPAYPDRPSIKWYHLQTTVCRPLQHHHQRETLLLCT